MCASGVSGSRGRSVPRIARMAREDAAASLLAEMPSYGRRGERGALKTIGDLACCPPARALPKLDETRFSLSELPALPEGDGEFGLDRDLSAWTR